MDSLRNGLEEAPQIFREKEQKTGQQEATGGRYQERAFAAGAHRFRILRICWIIP